MKQKRRTFYVYSFEGWVYVFKNKPKTRKDSLLTSASTRMYRDCFCVNEFAELTGLSLEEKKVTALKMRIVKE